MISHILYFKNCKKIHDQQTLLMLKYNYYFVNYTKMCIEISKKE